MSKQYTNEFFEKRKTVTQRSAQKIISELFSVFRPESVIDLGCGTGTWLAECKRQGVKEVVGVDGPWVNAELLEINRQEFFEHNLENTIYSANRKFDLAISIEVAEHLSEKSGSNLVASLTEVSDIVLFSAAVKGQGGTGHINEQPQHYWADKFYEHDFVCVELVRPAIWDQSEVNVIYKQNMCLYIRESVCHSAGLEKNIINSKFQIDRIHPDLLDLRSKRKQSSMLSRFGRMLKRLSVNPTR